MLQVLIFLDVDIDGHLSRYHRRCIDIWDDISTYVFGFDNKYFLIILIIDGIDTTSTTVIVSMSMSQPSTSMAPSAGDGDTIDDVSMVDP
jgi:hypothetical protein